MCFLGLFPDASPMTSTPLRQSFNSLIPYPKRLSKFVVASQTLQKRCLNTSPERSITGQEAPSAQAYIKSGVISGKKTLVDVKKVIVIGSGGLSIGQAGEFDYSGAFRGRLQLSGYLGDPLRQSYWKGSSLDKLTASWNFRISSTQSIERSQRQIHPN